jgi:broad specificity phosphatase PhoE
MDLLWIRHGEPERIAPGTGVRADPALTEQGRDQARRIADWLSFEPVDAVLSSPMRRAIETATPIAEKLGVDVEIVDGLTEYDSNSDHYIPMEELRLNKDERFTAMVESRWDAFGADLPEVFRARVDATVAKIVARFAGKRVAVVCHGGVINVALGSVLGVEQPLWFEPGYTSLSRMLASRSGIRSIASLNELAHLTATRDRA